jgi:hypothetical protein
MRPPRIAATINRVIELPTAPLAISPRKMSKKCFQVMRTKACPKQTSDGRILSLDLSAPTLPA